MDCQRCGREIVRRRSGPEGSICERCYKHDYIARRAVARRAAQLETLVGVVAGDAPDVDRHAVVGCIERAAPREFEQRWAGVAAGGARRPAIRFASFLSGRRPPHRRARRSRRPGRRPAAMPRLPTRRRARSSDAGRAHVCPLLPGDASGRVRAMWEAPADHHPHTGGTADVQHVPEPRRDPLGGLRGLREDPPRQCPHRGRRRSVHDVLPTAPRALHRLRGVRTHHVAQRRAASLQPVLSTPSPTLRELWPRPTGRRPRHRGPA